MMTSHSSLLPGPACMPVDQWICPHSISFQSSLCQAPSTPTSLPFPSPHHHHLPSHRLSLSLTQDHHLPTPIFGSGMSRCHTPPVLQSSLCHPLQPALNSSRTLSPLSIPSLAPSTLCQPVLHHLHLLLLQNNLPQDVRHHTLKLTQDSSHPGKEPP